MFLTPYHTASHAMSDNALQAENEARAFAFWQSLGTARERFAGLFSDVRARARVLTENGHPIGLRMPDGREVGL
ncbi:MAG: hypothetical protein RIM33_08830 [Alphaproteobacteria bacterium]